MLVFDLFVDMPDILGLSKYFALLTVTVSRPATRWSAYETKVHNKSGKTWEFQLHTPQPRATTKQSHIGRDSQDSMLAAASSLCHLRYRQFAAVDHIVDKLML